VGFFPRPAGHKDDEARVVLQQLNDAAAECAVPTDNQNGEFRGHDAISPKVAC